MPSPLLGLAQPYLVAVVLEHQRGLYHALVHHGQNAHCGRSAPGPGRIFIPPTQPLQLHPFLLLGPLLGPWQTGSQYWTSLQTQQANGNWGGDGGEGSGGGGVGGGEGGGGDGGGGEGGGGDGGGGDGFAGAQKHAAPGLHLGFCFGVDLFQKTFVHFLFE